MWTTVFRTTKKFGPTGTETIGSALSISKRPETVCQPNIKQCISTTFAMMMAKVEKLILDANDAHAVFQVDTGHSGTMAVESKCPQL
mmetsp:Transcript_58876/g.104982  ORF Transcript_58876/g.104982 Transcript_58876/m.104982 type:complete len:87 (+) Transcript_58876:771-1031(+)